MSDDRLTPEERDLIEAALALVDTDVGTDAASIYRLDDAAVAYRKSTAPPESFEAYCLHFPGMPHGPNVTAYGNLAVFEKVDRGEVWRCTVTPIERVR